MGAIQACKQPCHCSCADRCHESITGNAPAAYVVKVQDLNSPRDLGEQTTTAGPEATDISHTELEAEAEEDLRQAEAEAQQVEASYGHLAEAEQMYAPPQAEPLTNWQQHEQEQEQLQQEQFQQQQQLRQEQLRQEQFRHEQLQQEQLQQEQLQQVLPPVEPVAENLPVPDAVVERPPSKERSSRSRSKEEGKSGENSSRRHSKQTLGEKAAAQRIAAENQQASPIQEGDEQEKRPKGLILGFQTPEGKMQEIVFGGRKPPLGINFTKMGQLTCKSVEPGGHGDQLGVVAGWMVHYVNGENVEGMEVAEILQRIKAAMATS